MPFFHSVHAYMNNSVLPALSFLTNKRIDNLTVENKEIILLVRNINPNKAMGSDGISGQMLLLCDNYLSWYMETC